eukprot:1922540-Pleurochrysis_carterae.AAC.1
MQSSLDTARRWWPHSAALAIAANDEQFSTRLAGRKSTAKSTRGDSRAAPVALEGALARRCVVTWNTAAAAVESIRNPFHSPETSAVEVGGRRLPRQLV